MTYETKMTKAESGWKATTTHSLGMTPAGERILELATYRSAFGDSALRSRASVFTVQDAGNGLQRKLYAFGGQGGDFSCIVRTIAKVRATEKTVRQAHEIALEMLPAVLAAATEHYLSPRRPEFLPH